MDIKGLKKVLPFLMKHQITPFIWGSQGVGKTETVETYCKEAGLECVVLHLASQEVGDLIGLLAKDEESGESYHMRPEWFPTKGRGIVFCDEANRAPTEVIQSMYSFMTPKRNIHTHVLPEGWFVVAAGNYNNERFQVTDTSDAAWMSRFCHLDFAPSVEEWLMYAENKGLDDLAGFIRNHPSMLELSEKNAGRLDMSFIVPDRRAWERGVGKLDFEEGIDEGLRYELYKGLVGEAAAAAFVSYKMKAQESISINQILKNYDKSGIRARVRKLNENAKEQRFDLLNQPIDELMVKIENTPNLLSAVGYIENLKAYLLDIPKEISMKAFLRLSDLKNFYGRDELVNNPEYVKKFVEAA